MKQRLLKNGNLAIICTAKEQAKLKRLSSLPDFESDWRMHCALRPLLETGRLHWSTPNEIGALTDAPILCTKDMQGDIKQAWGFMDYQVTSPQRELMNNGICIWQSGN